VHIHIDPSRQCPQGINERRQGHRFNTITVSDASRCTSELCIRLLSREVISYSIETVRGL